MPVNQIQISDETRKAQARIKLDFIPVTFTTDLQKRITALVATFVAATGIEPLYKTAAGWAAQIYAGLIQRVHPIVEEAKSEATEVVDGTSFGGEAAVYRSAVESAEKKYREKVKKAFKKALGNDRSNSRKLTGLKAERTELLVRIKDQVVRMTGDENAHIRSESKILEWVMRSALLGSFSTVEYLLGFGAYAFLGNDQIATGFSGGTVLAMLILTILAGECFSRMYAYRSALRTLAENYPDGYYDYDDRKVIIVRPSEKVELIAKSSLRGLIGLSVILLLMRIVVAFMDHETGPIAIGGALIMAALSGAFLLVELKIGMQYDADAYRKWKELNDRLDEVEDGIDEIENPDPEAPEDTTVQDELTKTLTVAHEEYLEVVRNPAETIERKIRVEAAKVEFFLAVIDRVAEAGKMIEDKLAELMVLICEAVLASNAGLDRDAMIPKRSQVQKLLTEAIGASSAFSVSEALIERMRQFQPPTIISLGLPAAITDFAFVNSEIEMAVRAELLNEDLQQPVALAEDI